MSFHIKSQSTNVKPLWIPIYHKHDNHSNNLRRKLLRHVKWHHWQYTSQSTLNKLNNNRDNWVTNHQFVTVINRSAVIRNKMASSAAQGTHNIFYPCTTHAVLLIQHLYRQPHSMQPMFYHNNILSKRSVTPVHRLTNNYLARDTFREQHLILKTSGLFNRTNFVSVFPKACPHSGCSTLAALGSKRFHFGILIRVSYRWLILRTSTIRYRHDDLGSSWHSARAVGGVVLVASTRSSFTVLVKASQNPAFDQLPNLKEHQMVNIGKV